jgi:predicted AlkP superfamily pyrophosphatase or phosphodiesterase
MHFEEGDAYAENYGRALKFMTDNRKVPTVTFLYSVHTDHAGHRYAWMSPEYLASIEEGDRAIGELLAKMKEAGIYDDTHFFFLTDHGGINKGHGGVTTHEMLVPWGVSGPGIRKGLVMSEPNNHLNTASVILRLFGLEQPDCWVGEVPESIFA